MVKTRDKLKRGGIDTIIAYVVVMIPLAYVLVFMIATLYHYTIQMSINQTVKETLIMASTYGTVTDSMIDDYMVPKIKKLINGQNIKIQFFVRELDSNGEVSAEKQVANYSNKKITFHSSDSERSTNGIATLQKGDLLGIAVQSVEPSVLNNVSKFSLFGSSTGGSTLYYSAYREEIIRNEYTP